MSWRKSWAARAQVRATRAFQFPQVDAIGSALNTNSDNTLSTRQYQAAAQVPAFELDLFGKLAIATATADNAAALS